VRANNVVEESSPGGIFLADVHGSGTVEVHDDKRRGEELSGSEIGGPHFRF